MGEERRGTGASQRQIGVLAPRGTAPNSAIIVMGEWAFVLACLSERTHMTRHIRTLSLLALLLITVGMAAAPAFARKPSGSARLTLTVSGPGAIRYAANQPQARDLGGTTKRPSTKLPVQRGTTVVLTAVPIAGTTFAGWTGSGCKGLRPRCSLRVGKALTVGASFDKAATTVRVSCADATFTGSALATCSATAVAADGLSSTVMVSYTGNVKAGTATATAAYPGDARHAASSGGGSFAIAKADSTTRVTCPVVTYTGAPQTPCSVAVTGAGGLSLAPTPGYRGAALDAGDASTASYSFDGDANHLGSSDSREFTIAKAPSSTTVSCPTSVFDGTELSPCTVTVTGAGGLSLTPSPSYLGDRTLPGSVATASYTYAGDANHLESAQITTIVIDRAPSATTVTCTDSTYDATAQETCTATVTGVAGLSLTPTVDYADNTSASISASGSYSFAGDATHEGSSDTAYFTIAKASSTATVTCGAGSVTYTGGALTPCTGSVVGAGISTSLIVDYLENTGAGEATASVSWSGDANHTASDDTTTFTIDKADSTINLSCGSAETYDGTAHDACDAPIFGVGPTIGAATITYTGNINAGTATADATWSGDDNYNGSTDSTTFTIAQATSTVTVDCGLATYSGTPQSPCSATATGAGGLSADVNVIYTGGQVNCVDNASAQATYPGDANHSASQMATGNYSVDPDSSRSDDGCGSPMP